jgi:hypothetical protein
MSSSVFPEQLEKCRNFGDIFGVVKKAVKLSTGRERAGLMLYLGNLPLYVGAFHGVGSNGIVLNRRLLRKVSFRETTELSSYVFMLLLHEYLHSLGYIGEEHVRSLVHEISKEHFGGDHPTSIYALNPPIPKIAPSELQPHSHDEIELEIIKDFDRSNLSYIN